MSRISPLPALWGLLLLAGCAAPGAPYRDAPVVLISIDTLRSDRLGSYGYAKAKTPALDALAREGVVFEDVFSHCPLTLPAHASLFTGLLPPAHGVRDNLGYTLDAGQRTIARRFREAGYATGGAVSAYVLRRATGIAEGFTLWDDTFETSAAAAMGDQQRDGAAATEAVARFAEAERGRRFFAFLHLYEPHAPYAPPERHRHHADPYDGEVAYADELVARLLGRLRSAGVYDKALIAVTSDHGEGLMDHGEQEHGFFLYREALQVPLILRLPGGRRGGTRVAGVAGLTDVAATLLDLAGLPADGIDGRSLRAALEGGRAAAGGKVYSETFYPRHHFGWSELFSATEDRYRFIRAPRSELFDRLRDPAERHDLAAQRPDAVAAISAWLQPRAAAAKAPAPVSAESREALAALGYVGGGAAPAASLPAGASLPDPKDKLAVYEAYRSAQLAQREGRLAEAAERLRAVVADSPGLLDAWQTLGTVFLRLGRPNDAVAAFDAMLRQDPTNAEAHLALARLHGLAGRRDRAEKHARLAAAREAGRGFEALAQLQLDQRRPDLAAESARKSLAAEPDRVLSRFVLATAERVAGRCEAAAGEYKRAIESAGRNKGLVAQGLHAGLADCLARLGREAEAEAEFKQEIALIPHSREGRIGLGLLLRSQGRDPEAREALAGIVTANPRAGADEYAIVVRTLQTLGDVEAARDWARRGRALHPADPRLR